jgi:hypothetical protein
MFCVKIIYDQIISLTFKTTRKFQKLERSIQISDLKNSNFLTSFDFNQKFLS